jgi:hypothetical protein
MASKSYFLEGSEIATKNSQMNSAVSKDLTRKGTYLGSMEVKTGLQIAVHWQQSASDTVENTPEGHDFLLTCDTLTSNTLTTSLEQTGSGSNSLLSREPLPSNKRRMLMLTF